jgi:hypothetical protein
MKKVRRFREVIAVPNSLPALGTHLADTDLMQLSESYQRIIAENFRKVFLYAVREIFSRTE